MKMRIMEMPFDKVRDYLNDGGEGIVIPFGTVEPHGPHLPMGTDCLLAQSIGERIAENFKWLITPTLNFGVNNSLAVYPGATTIDEDVYESFVLQLIEGYVKLGFTYIVISNGHGPNSGPLQNAAKELTIRYPDARIMIIDWWYLDDVPRKDVYGDKAPGHAGVDETAAVIYFHGDLVNPDRFKKEASWVKESGFKVYPAPASCIIGDQKSIPDFDAGKAARFTEKVLDIIMSKIQDALNGFEHNLDG